MAAAVALAPCITGTTMALMMQQKWVLDFHVEGLQLSAPHQHGRMIEIQVNVYVS